MLVEKRCHHEEERCHRGESDADPARPQARTRHRGLAACGGLVGMAEVALHGSPARSLVPLRRRWNRQSVLVPLVRKCDSRRAGGFAYWRCALEAGPLRKKEAAMKRSLVALSLAVLATAGC